MLPKPIAPLANSGQSCCKNNK